MRVKIEYLVIAALVVVIVYLYTTRREHMGEVTKDSSGNPTTVTTSCPAGYAYDAVSKSCAPVNQGQGAGPLPSGSGTSTSPAPAVTEGPVTNTAPMTTPVATMPPVSTPPPSSVTPATTTSSTPARS
jgi:hypothetical protein